MNGLIKDGVVRRCWIVRHGSGTARAGNEQQPTARSDPEQGYICPANGNTSHIPTWKH